ncbi:GntR family transcriptional regulator [Pandoraea terrae]|uniref:GntR family transcriptional regulator n=1 Tax=Pandoraea terrae TaxID=1537710 RepID=A0A5E4S617_9BURK|nr:FadR/GntR family transcriptional regulator [Pandoraea terrae]VVD70701.1 GntR family transcriptional regulator [Pandoraea terrae]
MAVELKPVHAGARLSEQVADTLAQHIRDGAFPAGEKLPSEAQLVEQFKVSRTVIREAVSQLKSLGLVVSRQGFGVVVQEPGIRPLAFDAGHVASRKAVVQMAEVRRVLEAEAARQAAANRSDEDLRTIRNAVTALADAARKGLDGVEEDVNFHRSIAAATGNPFLIATLDYLSQYLRSAVQVTRANEARREDFFQEVLREHDAIVKAIEKGDPTGARKAAANHMDNAIRRIRAADQAFWDMEGARLAQTLRTL